MCTVFFFLLRCLVSVEFSFVDVPSRLKKRSGNLRRFVGKNISGIKHGTGCIPGGGGAVVKVTVGVRITKPPTPFHMYF